MTHWSEDGKVTKEDCEKAAEEARTLKRKRDGSEDMTGEKKKAPVKPDGTDNDEIIPDLDDPDIPPFVWDSFLKDGKITKEDREKAAQYADEAGRMKRKRDGREDMTGERKKAKCAPVKPEACSVPEHDTTNEAKPSVMHQEKPVDYVKFERLKRTSQAQRMRYIVDSV
eukprot:g2303.t1